MLTCMYQPPAVSLGKTCLLRVNRDTKKVIVKQFTPSRGGHVRVELVQSSYNFISPKRKSVVDIDARRNSIRRPNSESPSNDEGEEDTTDPESDDSSSLSETCGLGVVELEEMASRQARQLETQEQLLAAKAQRLRYLKSGGEAERLLRLREKVATQEERLRKLRVLRGKVQSNRNGNAVLSSDLESLRAVFNEKEKELSVAVAKVDELTRQLEDLRGGNKELPNGTLSNHIGSNGQSAASMELEKLRRELMYRQKLREAQASRVADQRAKLTQRQEESNRVDRRIAELQERLHRKRFLNHQLAVTLKHQENVEDFLNSSGLVPIPNKNDLKYQTLPYNAKFTPFGVKQEPQQYQDVQDNGKFDKAIQQMQIIALDHQQSPPQHPANNNKLMNSYSSINFQQLHQVLSQNHQNTKSANSSSTNVIADQSASNIQTNGIGHHLPPRRSMSDNGSQETGACPVIRPNNFVSTEPPIRTANPATHFNSLSGTTRDVTSSVGSNGSISGSSSEEVSGASYQDSDGKLSRPALPPKPSKPTLPTSAYLQRKTDDGKGMIPDRTELPIKPKPLFLKKVSGTSEIGTIATSVPPPTTSIGSQDRESPSPIGTNGNGTSNKSMLRMSVNRRIEMPPAFLFPESDPPPSDLVPEQYLSSATSSLSSTSLSSSLLGGNDSSKNSETGLRSTDTVDAAPLIHSHQKGSIQLGIEEYTLPDLFPTATSATVHIDEGNFIKQNPTVLSPNHNTNQYPSTLLLSNGQKTHMRAGINYSNNNNNNYQQETQILGEINNTKLVSSNNGSPNGNTNYNNPFNGQHGSFQDHVAVMRVQLESRSPRLSQEDEFSTMKSKESPDAVIESSNQGRGEQNFFYENGNQNDNNYDPSPDSSEPNGNSASNNRHPHAPIPGIIKRMKKGNLKAGNKESSPNGRRVSFDPLALLLDASLEGELELVMKTAKEVGNPSAANDEGITALHNAICAGHAEVVQFLVEFGCDVNAQDSDGWTPLHCAASCNNVGMVKFLVEHGACIFATTLSDHETAAEKCEEDEDGFGPCSEYLYSIQEKLGIINNGIVYAVFDYEAQNPDELSFDEGKRLTVLRKGDEVEREWWWSNSENETSGYIPRNLLGLYPRVIPEKRKAES